MASDYCIRQHDFELCPDPFFLFGETVLLQDWQIWFSNLMTDVETLGLKTEQSRKNSRKKKKEVL